MEHYEENPLTQTALVRRMQELGCASVTARRIAGWRKNDLLPAFDFSGRGRGKGQGRGSNGWLDGERVLSQALRVHQLLQTHKAVVDLYVPLWILGYPIPLTRIRAGLSKPLDTTTKDLACEINEGISVEDYIDDVTYEFSEGVKRANWNVLDMPQETLAAVLNILLNSAYDMKDQPFEDGVQSLGAWERIFQQKCLDLLDDARLVSNAEQVPSESGIFRHAEFVHEYLSVPHLRQVINECTDEDLLAVGNDLRVGREIIGEIERLLPIVLPYIPEEMQPSGDEPLETLVSVSKILTWIDLSLRRSGHGNLIGLVLSSMLEAIRRQSGEELQKTMTEYGSEITEMLTFIKHFGNWLSEESPIGTGQPA
jgi:hypothetical protein